MQDFEDAVGDSFGLMVDVYLYIFIISIFQARFYHQNESILLSFQMQRFKIEYVI